MKLFEAASWFCWTRQEAILTPGLQQWMAAYPLFVASCLWFIFFMSDEQAAVIYRRVASRSWRNNNCSLFIRHKDEYLSWSKYSCISWSRYTWLGRISCIFMCFSIIFQTNSCGFFVCFPGEIALSSILRIKTIFFGCHSILREKKSQLASNFQLTRTLAMEPWWLSQSKR